MQHEPTCTIVLVRHGETEANVRGHFADSDEILLTEAGRIQAQNLALRLGREIRPCALISSTFVRARETSAIIGRALGLPVEEIGGIHERDFGRFRGQAYERLAEAMQAENLSGDRIRHWTPEGGESLEDVRLRVIAALDNLRILYEGRRIVVVTHGAVIRSIYSHITGDWSRNYVIPNCTAVVVAHTGSGWQLLK